MSVDVDVRPQIVEEVCDVLLAIQKPLRRGLSVASPRAPGLHLRHRTRGSGAAKLLHAAVPPGLDAQVTGDMTTPHLGAGDLLVSSSGPGCFSMVAALMGVVCASSGKVTMLTANPSAKLVGKTDETIVIPGQTMAAGTGGRASIQPMGSLYEQAMCLYFDYVVQRLTRRLNRSFADMSHRHANLE